VLAEQAVWLALIGVALEQEQLQPLVQILLLIQAHQ
jgi:hypothetical protein